MSKEKVRLYQLARELNVESKDLIDLLQAVGADVKNHMTALDPETKQLAIDLATGKVKASQVVMSAPPAPAPPPPPSLDALAKGKKVQSISAPTKKKTEKSTDPDVEAPPAEPETTAEPEESAAPEAPAPEAPDDEPPAIAAKAPTKPTESIERPTVPGPALPPRSLQPIPDPTGSRIRTLHGGQAGANEDKPRPRRDTRAPARPSLSLPSSLPGGVKPPTAPPKPPLTGPKPLMRISAEDIRAGKLSMPDAREALAMGRGLELEPVPVEVEEEADAKKGPGMTGRADRQARRQRNASRQDFLRAGETEEDLAARLRRPLRQRAKQRQAINSPKGPVVLETPITVRSFCEAAGVQSRVVLKKLMMDMSLMISINDTLTDEQVEMLALALELNVKIEKARTVEQDFHEQFTAEEENPEDLVDRSPVVTFMGHVDHGKTSLMDKIRSANVAAGEAGGITQHIGAYRVTLPDSGQTITFLDTPGHEAFTEMRARGANVTDIVVLVVAADDGIMPQTEEAISHAKAAGVAIVVAINKSDLPGANSDRVKQQLSKYELVPEEWGGKTLMVNTSAITGMGMAELLEAILLTAELGVEGELKANPNRPATGTCIEASMHEQKGVKATLLVQNGTLRLGDAIVCGTAVGRVRAMIDEHGQALTEAGPSCPAAISGLDQVPAAGEKFLIMEDYTKAREIAEQRRAKLAAPIAKRHTTLESLFASKSRQLSIILKTDVRGSLEAIKKEVGKLSHLEVEVRVIHEGIGAINESDVALADASDAIIVGFQVVPDSRAESLASEKEVEIRRYNIIYQVTDDIKKALEGMLAPEKKEVQLGKAVVRQIFNFSKVGSIAGCMVVQGTIERDSKLRVIRDGKVIGTYPIETLRRFKDDAKSVREGMECGIKLGNFDDIKSEDVFESFRIEEIKRSL